MILNPGSCYLGFRSKNFCWIPSCGSIRPSQLRSNFANLSLCGPSGHLTLVHVGASKVGGFHPEKGRIYVGLEAMNQNRCYGPVFLNLPFRYLSICSKSCSTIVVKLCSAQPWKYLIYCITSALSDREWWMMPWNRCQTFCLRLSSIASLVVGSEGNLDGIQQFFHFQPSSNADGIMQYWDEHSGSIADRINLQSSKGRSDSSA